MNLAAEFASSTVDFSLRLCQQVGSDKPMGHHQVAFQSCKMKIYTHCCFPTFVSPKAFSATAARQWSALANVCGLFAMHLIVLCLEMGQIAFLRGHLVVANLALQLLLWGRLLAFQNGRQWDFWVLKELL